MCMSVAEVILFYTFECLLTFDDRFDEGRGLLLLSW